MTLTFPHLIDLKGKQVSKTEKTPRSCSKLPASRCFTLFIKLYFLNQVLDKALAHLGQASLFVLDIDQLDWVIDIQRDGDDIVSVEVTVENTGRNRVAIQTDQKVKEGCTVADDDRFFMVLLRENFLRKVEGVVSPLVIAEIREILQVRQLHQLFLGQRIGLADKDMGLSCEEVGRN